MAVLRNLRTEALVARSTTHGATIGGKTRTYRIWVGMRNRCYNERNPKYQHYGAKGVVICDRWSAYENFLADMGAVPDGLTIERIDTNGNYEPSNCKWADQKEQQNNRTNNRRVVVNGTCIFNILEVEELVGLSRQTISRRIAAKQPIVIGNKVFNIAEYVRRG